MSVQVKKGVLQKFLKKVLFEDNEEEVTVDSIDGFRTAAEDDTTIPDEVPVEASEQMATQLTQERPPIEDDDFIPSSSIELGLAANAWARLVPDDQVEYFYEKLKLIYDAALEKHNMPEEMEEEEIDVTEEEIEETNESFLISSARHNIRKLLEQHGPEGEYLAYRGIDVLEDEAEDVEDVPSMPTKGPGTGLEDLASEFGYSSASGVRQDLERIFKRLGFTVENITDEQLDAIRSYAQGEFITELLAQELIDEEDASELRANPDEVSGLDSFRFFFVSGFVLPAYQQVARDSRKRIETEIEKLGLPQKTKQTVMNQVLGDTPKNMQKLSSKLMRDAQAEGKGDEEANAVLKSVIAAFPNLVKIGKIEGDIISIAMDKWQRASPGKKKNIMSKALTSTEEFQN